MMCLNPMVLHRPNLDDMVIPCGMCRWCRIMRANLWAMRMMHEAEYHEENVFITLTYNDEWLQEDRSVSRKVLQDFWKRLRKEVEPRRIKYYACGEYGERFGRPHYHAVVFGLGYRDRKCIDKAWPFGFNRVERVCLRTCRYVAKYIMKAPLGRSLDNEFERTGRCAPFQVSSRGIGLSWVMERAERIGERGIWHKGRRVSVPRYYLKKLRDGGLLRDCVTEDVKADAVQRFVQECREYEALGIDWTDGELMSRRYQERQGARIEQVRSLDSLHGRKDRDSQ